MIYDYPSAGTPIRQGDIFIGLPRVDVSLSKLTVIEDIEEFETDWEIVVQSGQPVTAILPVRPVTAIVVTQDCDAARNPEITLCEIRGFRDVEGMAKETKSASSWVKILTQHARVNLKWFYLPPDDRIGFTDKLAVDFSLTIRVPRPELEEYRHQRRGRLNSIAYEHFRERLGEYYRRYPYDEWYPLNNEELSEYRKRHPDIEPYPWQNNYEETQNP